MVNEIIVDDFNVFVDMLKAAAKLVDAAKLMFSPNGLEIYGARDIAARCELMTNAVHSNDTFDFCVESIAMLNKILTTVKEVHEGDYSELEMTYSRPNLLFKSKKMRTKYSTCNESTIAKWVSKKIVTPMNAVFSFKTSSDIIKRMNGHSFMFTDFKSIKVYLETKDDMEANAVFATLGNKNMDLGREMTLKFGLVTDGKIPEGRDLIIDIERMNLLNCVQSDDIVVSLMDKNVLLSKTNIHGKDGTYFNINVYCTLLKG